MRQRRAVTLSIVIVVVGARAGGQPLSKPIGITFARGGGLMSSSASYVHGGVDVKEQNQSFIYPVDVVLRNLATVCKRGANPGPISAGSFAFDLTSNSASTGVQTVCDTSTWIARDTEHSSEVVAAGQFVTLKATPASSPPANTQLFASWQTFDTDAVTPLVFIEGGGGFSTPKNGQYCDIMKGSCNSASASVAARVVAAGFAVDRLAVTMATSPVSTNSETYCLRNITKATDIVCTAGVSAPSRTAISPECTSSCTVEAGDEIAIRVDVVGGGQATTRHFAIHVTGGSTQILYGGNSAALLAGAGPVGADFTTSPQLAVFPVATAVSLAKLYALAESAATQTIGVAAGGDCDLPVSGGSRPSCTLSHDTSCTDDSTSFTLHAPGCLLVEHSAGGTFNVRIRGGVELSEGPPSCAADCNSDDLVTPQEAIYAIGTVLGLHPPSGCQGADVNQDDVVSIEDLVDGVIGACGP